MPQSEWYEYPHAHEPYWTEEAYEVMQQKYATVKERYVRAADQSEILRQNSPNIFQEKVYCGRCGRQLSYVRAKGVASSTKPRAIFYRCKNQHGQKEPCLVNRRIELNALEMIVMRQVHLLIQTATNKKEIIEKAIHKQGSSKKEMPIERKIGRLTEKIQELDEKLIKAYTDYADQLLKEDEYMAIKQRFQEMRKAFVMEQQEQKRRLDDMQQVVSRFCKWAEQLKDGTEGPEYRKKLIDEVVSKVIVEGIDHVTVVFGCQDVFRQELIDAYLMQIHEV